jgi:hypothetical protein
MANETNETCLGCGHPQSEHVNSGCNHMDDMGPQSHGNPERKICTCDGFKRKSQNRVMARPVDPREKHIPKKPGK